MDKKQTIIQLAQEAIQKKGVNSVSFRELAQKAGIKSSSVHYYFPTKNDLIHEIIYHYNEAFESILEDLASKNMKCVDTLLAFADIFITVYKKDRRFCLCGMLASDVLSLDEVSELKLSHFFQLTEKWLVQIMKKGRANKELKNNDLDSKITAQAVLSLLEGALLIDRLSKKPEYLMNAKKFIKNL